MSAGKGSARRPASVPAETVAERWERTFGGKEHSATNRAVGADNPHGDDTVAQGSRCRRELAAQPCAKPHVLTCPQCRGEQIYGYNKERPAICGACGGTGRAKEAT